MPRRMLALALIALILPSARSQESLADRIGSVINGTDFRQAHWGLLDVDAKTGEKVFEHNADRLFTPASTTKLYTTAGPLAAFGPQYKFETPVYRRGEVSEGRLRGDLILVASGDLTMGGRTQPDGKMAFANSDHTYAGPATTEHELTPTNPLAGLANLAEQVYQGGVRIIQGDVLIDDRLFPHARGSGSGPDLLTPIVINDNVVDLSVTPGDAVNQLASVRMRPETNWVRMDVQVVTATS